MIEHDTRLGDGPVSYTTSLPHSLLAAATQRATSRDGRLDSGSRDAADLERWEAEGGAAAAAAEKATSVRDDARGGVYMT